MAHTRNIQMEELGERTPLVRTNPLSVNGICWWLLAVFFGGFCGLLMGALSGWGVGVMIASYRQPCIDEKNDTAVEKCARTSKPAIIGSIVGGLVGGLFGVVAVGTCCASPRDPDSSREAISETCEFFLNACGGRN